jgi:hypothetical protein
MLSGIEVDFEGFFVGGLERDLDHSQKVFKRIIGSQPNQHFLCGGVLLPSDHRRESPNKQSRSFSGLTVHALAIALLLWKGLVAFLVEALQKLVRLVLQMPTLSRITVQFHYGSATTEPIVVLTKVDVSDAR